MKVLLLVLCFFGVGTSAQCMNPKDMTSTFGFKPDQNKMEPGRANYYDACGSPFFNKEPWQQRWQWYCNYETQYIVPANKVLVIESSITRALKVRYNKTVHYNVNNFVSESWSAIVSGGGIQFPQMFSGPAVYQSGEVLSLKVSRNRSFWIHELSKDTAIKNAEISKDGLYDVKITARMFDKAAYDSGSQCY